MTDIAGDVMNVVVRSSELVWIAKASLVLAAGWVALLASRQARASVRHLVLVVTFGSLVALPVLMMGAPVVSIEAPFGVAAVDAEPGGEPSPGAVAIRRALAPAPPAAAGASARGASMPSVLAMLRVVWIVGACWLAASLALGVARLRGIARDGAPWLDVRPLVQELTALADLRRPVHVVLHEQIQAPMTCGVFRPVIVMPRDAVTWCDDDVRRALVHELEHVRRADWATQLAARAICAVYWFHPLAWATQRSLCLEAERACDDAVLAHGASEDYAEQLVTLASRLRRGRALPALAMANRSDLAVRVHALLDAGQRRGRVGTWTTATAMVVALVGVATLSSVRTVRAATTVNRGASTPAATPAPTTASASAQPSVADETRAALGGLLLEAADRGDLTRMNALIAAGADLDAVRSGDGSPLIVAARSGRLAAVRLLLERGANPNLAVPGDGNPLIMAAREGHGEIVELLLTRGAAIDEIVPEDENALIQASAAGRLAVVRLLVARGADVNARAWTEPANDRGTGEWRTPLSQARRGRHAEVVAFLEASGARD